MVLFLRNRLPRIKDRVYVMNPGDNSSKGTHWVSLYIDRKTADYFFFFGIDDTPQEVLNIIKEKSITHNIFRIQDNDSIMCGIYCIAFIEYIFAGKFLLDYTHLFSLNDYKKNGKYFKDKYDKP